MTHSMPLKPEIDRPLDRVPRERAGTETQRRQALRSRVGRLRIAGICGSRKSGLG